MLIAGRASSVSAAAAFSDMAMHLDPCHLSVSGCFFLS